MRRFSMLLPLLAMFLVVAHTIETGMHISHGFSGSRWTLLWLIEGATELDQAEAYDGICP